MEHPLCPTPVDEPGQDAHSGPFEERPLPGPFYRGRRKGLVKWLTRRFAPCGHLPPGPRAPEGLPADGCRSGRVRRGVGARIRTGYVSAPDQGCRSYEPGLTIVSSFFCCTTM